MGAHTPGPWSVDGEGIRALVRGGTGVIVAVRHRLPAREHESNARLIAAAPEMLDKLSEALNYLEGLDIADEIEALIAKATGSQP